MSEPTLYTVATPDQVTDLLRALSAQYWRLGRDTSDPTHRRQWHHIADVLSMVAEDFAVMIDGNRGEK